LELLAIHAEKSFAMQSIKRDSIKAYQGNRDSIPDAFEQVLDFFPSHQHGKTLRLTCRRAKK
jgi:hypothetical protein